MLHIKALVAGVNIVLALEMTLSLSTMEFLSPDSRCYSFDERAKGYARGEGCGVVILKRVVDAVRDGDNIRAIIRSTGSTQDGFTPGITQPSKESQALLIKETYDKAELDFSTTRFVKAHGTFVITTIHLSLLMNFFAGTGAKVGDPIEAEAIGSVFRSFRSSQDPLFMLVNS